MTGPRDPCAHFTDETSEGKRAQCVTPSACRLTYFGELPCLPGSLCPRVGGGGRLPWQVLGQAFSPRPPPTRVKAAAWAGWRPDPHGQLQSTSPGAPHVTGPTSCPRGERSSRLLRGKSSQWHTWVAQESSCRLLTPQVVSPHLGTPHSSSHGRHLHSSEGETFALLLFLAPPRGHRGSPLGQLHLPAACEGAGPRRLATRPQGLSITHLALRTTVPASQQQDKWNRRMGSFVIPN